MRHPACSPSFSGCLALLLALTWLAIPGCEPRDQRTEEEEKVVDIETPRGQLEVSSDRAENEEPEQINITVQGDEPRSE